MSKTSSWSINYYQKLNDSNRNFIWAGMARMAGGSVVRGLEECGDVIGGSELLGDQWTWPATKITEASQAIAEAVQGLLLWMQQLIFMDLAWQHEAYKSGGLAEMTKLFNNGQLDPGAYAAWQAIDLGMSGDTDSSNTSLWNGNLLLLQREQQVVIAPGYQQLATLPLLPTVMGWMVETPYAVAGGGAFSASQYGGPVTTFAARWQWVTQQMFNPWQNTPEADRDFLIDDSFSNLINGFPEY